MFNDFISVASYFLYITVHVGSVRQTATIISMTAQHLRTSDKALCRFRFIKNPEYLHTGMRMLFREGLTKAVGTIVKLFPHVSAIAQNTRQQRMQAKKAAEHNHQGGITNTLNPQNEPQKPSKKNRRGRGSRHNRDGGETNGYTNGDSQQAESSASSHLSGAGGGGGTAVKT